MIEDDVLSIKETSSEEKWRMISILSYVIVLIGFGVPIWWHTTKVYRASLPLDEMLQMHPISAPPLQIEVYARTEQRSTVLTQEIASLLGSTVAVALHRNKINLPVSDEEDAIEFAAQSIQINAGSLVFIEWPKSHRTIVFTSRRVVFFKGEVSGYQLAMLVQKWPAVDLKTALSDPSRTAADSESVRPFPAAPIYDVLVTVVNPKPQELSVDWDIVEAIDEHIKPYLNQLHDIANFTVKSQWLYFVDLGDNPRQVGDHWALAEQLLPHIITPLEKKLASHVSKYPCINLVIYVPSCPMAPLHIYTKAGVKSSGPVDAFISPRWGGVTIANPPNCPSTSFTPNSLEIMSILTTQLTQLLGIPNLSAAAGDLLQTGPKPALWQRDHLMRARTLEYIDAARLTLQSLAQLLSQISNIVINDEVAASVQLAVDSVKRATDRLRRGDVFGALEAAQIAAVSSESAFTDPTLLALLYFPDDQKYAVYIPLFLPIMIPVIMSLRQLVQYAKHLQKPMEV